MKNHKIIVMDQRLLKKMLADAQENKRLMDRKIHEIQTSTFTTSQGKDLIKMSSNGKYEIISCQISDQLLEDKETLEDLIISAVNDLVSQINKKLVEVEKKFIPKNIF